MSRLWNSTRLYAYLADEQLTAVLSKGVLRPVLLDHKVFPVVAGDLATAMAAMSTAWPLAGNGARLMLILGGQSVRYLMLPWNTGLSSKALREKIAGALFESQFQQSASGWRFAFGPVTYGRAVPVACVQQPKLDALKADLRQQGISLSSVQPLLMALWNHHHQSLGRQTGVLLIREGQRVLRVDHDGGHIGNITRRPLRDEEVSSFLSSIKGPVQWASSLPTAQAVPAAVHVMRPDRRASFDAAPELADFALYGVG